MPLLQHLNCRTMEVRVAQMNMPHIHMTTRGWIFGTLRRSRESWNNSKVWQRLLKVGCFSPWSSSSFNQAHSSAWGWSANLRICCRNENRVSPKWPKELYNQLTQLYNIDQFGCNQLSWFRRADAFYSWTGRTYQPILLAISKRAIKPTIHTFVSRQY